MRDTTPAEDAQNAADALAVLVAGEALDACVSVRHVFDLVSERSPDDENRVVVEAAWSALWATINAFVSVRTAYAEAQEVADGLREADEIRRRMEDETDS